MQCVSDIFVFIVPLGYSVMLLDTPGHVDFSCEVERAMRTTDGAVLVLCAVSSVQSQTLTVDRQMKRYRVPRITFVNKCDRAGANVWRTVEQVQSKLGIRCAALQVPIGVESDLSGIVDVIEREAVYFDGASGETVRREPGVPEAMVAVVEERRKLLIEALADVDEEFGDLYLMDEESISGADIKAAIRRATIARVFSPVLVGSALKNTGVQLLLDGVADYLPNPSQRENTAFRRIRMDADEEVEASEKEAGTRVFTSDDGNTYREDTIVLQSDITSPLVCLAFKLEEGRFGQLTYVRVYQGSLKRGDFVINARTGKKMKIPRLVRMHGGDMEDIQEAVAGDICAIFGLECASGDTFVAASAKPDKLTLESMYVPEPVISLAVEPKQKDGGSGNFTKALNRFCREDPTFRVRLDAESKQTIISGMGELHLDVYIERMAREYGVELTVGAPNVNYRETVQQKAEFNYLHKKQSGGSGQFAGVMGYIEPTEDGKSVEFKNAVIGNNIPPGFFAAIQKGFQEAMDEGALSGHKVQGVRMVITDGRTHPVDSNELAFRMATIQGFRQAFPKAKATVLEPIMNVSVQVPSEFQGNVMGGLSKRRGAIANTEPQGEYVSIEAEIPLGEMFGYATELRSATQGKGEYSMEYKVHSSAPQHEIQRLMKEYQEKKDTGRT